jgi:hypothetical protein
MNNVNVAATETRHRFHTSLLQAFDEIAQGLLTAPHKREYVSLQNYLDGSVAIGGGFFARRAILLAIHDMKEDMEAPLALQKRALDEFESLKMRPAPSLKLYRDIATAMLRMEVVMRSAALHAMEYAETRH